MGKSPPIKELSSKKVLIKEIQMETWETFKIEMSHYELKAERWKILPQSTHEHRSIIFQQVGRNV